MKSLPTEWEKILTNNIFNNGLISKLYRELTRHKKQHKTKRFKNELRIDIFPEKTYRWTTGMKSCSASLISRDRHTKTTTSYHFIPLRMAVIEKTSNKYW